MKNLLEKFPMLSRIAANFGWRMAERVIAVSFSILIGAWVARYLGPDAFGVLASALAIVLLIQVFPFLGLDRILVRELVEKPDEEGAILGTAGLMTLVSGIAAFALTALLLFSLPVSDDLRKATLLIASWFFGAPAVVVRAWFEKELKGSRDAVAGILGLLIGAAIRIGLIITNQPMWIFGAAIGIEVFSAAILRTLFFRLSGGRFSRWKFESKRALSFLREATPQIIGLFAFLVYMRIDTLMVKAIAGDTEAGIYAAAARLAEGLFFVPAVMASVLFPSLINARKANRRIFETRLQSYFRLNAAMGYGLALAGALLAPFVVVTLFGPAYSSSIGVLVIYVWAAVPYFIGYVRQETFVAEGLIKLNLVITVIGALSNVALNFLLIPLWAGNGAAFATLISYSVAALLAPWFFPSSRKIGLMAVKAILWPVPSLKGAEGINPPQQPTGEGLRA